MNRIITISAILLSSFTNLTSAHVIEQVETATCIDGRFNFDNDSFDPTTIFTCFEGLEAEEAEAEDMVEAEDVIEYAKKYLGRPYRYGAKGPTSFDCSGFTSYVYRNFDIILSPSSRTQATQGEKIARADIQPGDLLFFTGRRSKGAVGHVGIATEVDEAGNITFIHASTANGIRYNKLTDGYYSKRFVGARRVLNNI